LNGNKNIRRKIKNIGYREVCTTVISIAELKFGAYHSAKIEANLERIAKLQKKLTVLHDINEAIAF
jgi:predicted nucleic acid-binding protein